jgi:hypothetical protein
MQDPYPFSRPLGLGDLLDRTFRVYRARFGVLTLTAAVLLVPIGLVSGVLTGQFMVSYVDFVEGLATSPASDPEAMLGEVAMSAAGFAGVTVLLAVVGMVGTGLVSLAATRHAVALLQSEELSVWQGLQGALSRFLPFVGMFVVRGISMVLAALTVFLFVGFVAFLVIAVIGGAAVLLGDAVSSDAGIVGMIGLVILACSGYVVALALVFAPVVYLGARWIVAVPGLVAEQKGPLESLGRSWRLTVKNVWRSIGYAILLSILNLAVITIPVSIIQQVLGLLFPFSPAIILAISGALSSIFNVLWQPLYACAIVLLYFDLRVRRENYDLEIRVRQLEAEVDSRATP